jgi:outer membrane protein TolC
MKIWKNRIAGAVVAIAAELGCQQQCFLSEQDFVHAHGLSIPAHLECDSQASCLHRAGSTPPPTTVLDTNREPRYLSLREAIAVAVENGTVGTQAAANPGLAVDSLGAFAGTTVQGADAIRVFALDPAITATNIEISSSKFDALWNTSATWNYTETPLGTSPTNFARAPTVTSVRTDDVTLSTGLIKPLPTGGVAGITFSTSYMHNNPPAAINPAYQPDLQFVFEQPLLRGFGEEINQLRPAHPNSLLQPFPVFGQVEGILITRIRLDQQRAEFERNLNFLLLNVEAAYWNLYGAYFQLYSREEGMRYAFESWRLTRLGLETGGRATEQDLEQARLQYEQFRSQRLAALGQVLESERQLRSLMGLKVEDGFRLVPADSPTLTPFVPNWRIALDEALAQRPELDLARQDLKFRQLDLLRVKNDLLPDLRFVATDDIHSIGTHLDEGPKPDNAFHRLFSHPFDNFSLGLRMNVPIGFRSAHAAVRAARLELERSYLSLQVEEDKAERFLGLAYRQVFEFQEQIQVNQAAFRAATLQLQKYYELFQIGRNKPFGADLILAQRDWSNSVASLYTSIVQYNNALATLEFAKGTIMQHDGVVIADGPLPNCAQVRAVEHERERTNALLLKQRGLPGNGVTCASTNGTIVPELPVNTAVSLPLLQQHQKPVPELPNGGGTESPLTRPKE